MSIDNPTTSGAAANDPDAIRADIERTRQGLSRDVNALGESVTPGHLAHRQAEKVKSRAGRLRDHVMGSASDAGGKASDAAHGVGDKASDVAHGVGDKASDVAHGLTGAAQQAGDTVGRKAQGNPLAAGFVALAAGWLVGSLLPASEKERRLAESAKDKAQPLLEEAQSVAKDVASESGENLKQPAQEAVGSVKETALSAADDVKQQGQQAAGDVRDSASESADSVKQQAQS